MSDYRNKIAELALNHYWNVLPKNKGKPQQDREWTVYAAMVAMYQTSSNNNLDVGDRIKDEDGWVVCCATGSKCTSLCSDCTTNVGWMIHDGHAEVLVRRGFQRVLWQEILQQQSKAEEASIQNSQSSSLSNKYSSQRSLLIPKILNDDMTTRHWGLRSDISLHLYISDSPCGDASIYRITHKHHHQINHTSSTNASIAATTCPDLATIHDGNNDNHHARIDSTNTTESSMNFTGAKIILSNIPNTSSTELLTNSICSSADNNNNERNSNQTDIQKKTKGVSSLSSLLGREQEDQYLGVLRTKSGRSDLPSHKRSTSMSCSDKLCRYQIFGYQGSLLSSTKLIPKPIGMSSIIVSHDPRSCYNSTKTTTTTQHEALQRAIPQRIQKSIRFIQQLQHSQTTSASTATEIIKKAMSHNTTLSSSFSFDSPEKQHINTSQYASQIIIPQVYTVPATFSQGKSIMEHKNNERQRKLLNSTMTTTAVSPTKVNTTTNDRAEKYVKSTAKEPNESIHTQTNVSTSNRTATITFPNVHPTSKKVQTNQSQEQKQLEKNQILRLSPCGVSLNWQYNDTMNNSIDRQKENVEIIVGAKGTRQGIRAKKRKRKKQTPYNNNNNTFQKNIDDDNNDDISTWKQMERTLPSRLSRWQLWKLARRFNSQEDLDCSSHLAGTNATKVLETVKSDKHGNKIESNEMTYQQFKRKCLTPDIQCIRSMILGSYVKSSNNLAGAEFENNTVKVCQSPLNGWIRNTKEGDFMMQYIK